MKKEIVYKLFSYHFGKIILNKRELTGNIKGIQSDFDKEKLEKLYFILSNYKNNEEYLEIDEFVLKAMKINFNVSKSSILNDMAVDNRIYRLFFEYLNEVNGLNHSFYVLLRNQKDLVSKLDFLEYDYNLVIKRQTQTLQSIGNEYGYTRERIRQKINEVKAVLKENVNALKLNYIYYEDVKYMSKVKQAIVFSDDDNNLQNVGMYVFNTRIKNVIQGVTENFKQMFVEENSNIEEIYKKNSLIIKRFLQYDEGFYVIKNKIYTTYDKNIKSEFKYFLNYLDEKGNREFLMNKALVDNFKNSIHGKLYEEAYEKKITQTSLKKLLEINEIIKLSGDKYLYDVDLNRWMIEEGKNIAEKLSKTVPIKNKEEFDNIFRREINIVGQDAFYYLLKRENNKEFKFSKYNVEKI